ncbi:MAG: hypothetical protein EBT71_02760 [Alphaproteobacteria bacterium]|nr:hypothetical protein [Alphaproteobacteria bacterium]
MDKTGGIFLAVVVSLVFATAIWQAIPQMRENMRQPEIIIMQVELVNLCRMDENVFIVKEPETGMTAHFSNGLTRMQLATDKQVRLAINPKYKDFRYDGELVAVAPNIKLVADCSSSPRQRDIFSSMREQFNPDKLD